MPRIPPDLLYLTIYNPTLHPTGPIDDDDEDAEEQAHILFYTSKERAVSRDRMLRQVGLTKALVTFSEIFNPYDACDNVHSQSKRMIMVSPEPNFWIHAAVEVARMPRSPAEQGKGKDKSRNSEKDGKQTTTYDGIDGSLHDFALRRAIERGYEQFKLTHGSFTSILSTLGKEALELQLERFFTPWAWSWDLEDSPDFRDHLGISLHPSFRSVVDLLDDFSSELPGGPLLVLLSPTHVVPSTQYTTADYSSSLSRHLLTRIPPVVPPSSESAPFHDRDTTITAKDVTHPDALSGKDPPVTEPQSSFINPAKWNWTGYLSFRRRTSNKLDLGENKPFSVPSDLEVPGPEDVSAVSPESCIDRSALLDAISENIPLPPLEADPGEAESAEVLPLSKESVSVTPESPVTIPEPSPEPLPEFLFTTVHLAEVSSPLATRRQKVCYILNDQLMLALVGLPKDAVSGDPKLVQQTLNFLGRIRDVIDEESADLMNDSLPSPARIPQRTDNHIANLRDFTISSPGFNVRSAHLYEAQSLQLRETDILEVFSRGQNPQHWHIARRGLRTAANERAVNEGGVYMAVYRKEASLGDVDNILAGVVRRCGLADGALYNASST